MTTASEIQRHSAFQLRWPLVAGIFALLLGAAIAVAIVIGTRQPELLPANTPEGVVQRYLQAFQDGNTDAAYRFLGNAVQDDFTYAQFLDYTQRELERDIRATLAGTKQIDSQVQVTVRLTSFEYSPPFGQNEWSQTVRFVLQEEQGSWRFASPPWPLPATPPLKPESP